MRRREAQSAMQPVTGRVPDGRVPAGRAAAGRAAAGRAIAGRGAVLRRPGAGEDLLTAWQSDPAAVLSSARCAGATILIASADFAADAASGERAASAIAGCGILAVISSGYGENFCTAVRKSGVLPICLPIGQITKLQDIVSAEQETLMTVDQASCEVTAGGKFSAVFKVAAGAARHVPGDPAGAGPSIPGDSEIAVGGRGVQAGSPAPGSARLADRIRAAQHRISSINVPADVRIQFQQRLVAVCEAMKAATADAARCERRLASLTVDLDRLAAAHDPGNPPDYNS